MSECSQAGFPATSTRSEDRTYRMHTFTDTANESFTEERNLGANLEPDTRSIIISDGFFHVCVVAIFSRRILMSQEVVTFLNSSVKNSLTSAIRELCLRKPYHQAYFIADFLERHAAALEKASIRKEESDRNLAAAPPTVVEERLEEFLPRELAPFSLVVDRALAWKAGQDPESLLQCVSQFMYENIAGATTSYVGKKVYGYNKSVEYMHVLGDRGTLPALMEGKGVTWGLWAEGAPLSSIYIEDVLFDRRVEFLVSYPRSGSLLLIRAGPEYVVGVDTAGSGVIGIDKTVRDFLVYILTHLGL